MSHSKTATWAGRACLLLCQAGQPRRHRRVPRRGPCAGRTGTAPHDDRTGLGQMSAPAGRPRRPAGGKAMSTTIRDRIGAATGALFVALIMVGNQMASGGPADSAHPTGEQVLRDVAHQASSATFTAGFVLEGLGFAA